MLDFYTPYKNCCREVAPQRFLFEWKSASEKEVAPPCFLFQSKSASHAEVAPLHFYFRTEIRFLRYRRGGRSSHMLLPCAFSRHIRQPTWACTRAKRENSQLAIYTALAPFSPSLMRWWMGGWRWHLTSGFGKQTESCREHNGWLWWRWSWWSWRIFNSRSCQDSTTNLEWVFWKGQWISIKSWIIYLITGLTEQAMKKVIPR